MQAILRHINFDGIAADTIHTYTRTHIQYVPVCVTHFSLFNLLFPSHLFWLSYGTVCHYCGLLLSPHNVCFFFCWIKRYKSCFSSLPSSTSGEVHAGRQSRVCEGPVHHLPLQRGSATGQQDPAGASTQIHAGTLVIRSQVLTQRYELAGPENNNNNNKNNNNHISSQGEKLVTCVLFLQKSSLTPLWQAGFLIPRWLCVLWSCFIIL